MIPFITAEEISTALPYPELIRSIGEAFAQNNAVTPLRHHHDFKNPPEDKDSTLLLMPSWVPGENLGVKIVTVSPNNGNHNLPSIQGIYLLFNAATGICKLLLDAKALTVSRTAATSALASQYLSRESSATLFMVGTGAVAPELILAHASVRPIRKVLVWGRNKDHAAAVCQRLQKAKFEIKVAETIAAGLKQADIISCATLSETPLIKGALLREGQHLDMVGAYRPHMREADDAAIMRSSVFVDHFEGALKETGEIVIPMREGVLKREDIKASLYELCSRTKKGRSSEKEITFFKSVGHAMEDLVAAKMVSEKLTDGIKTVIRHS
ncbi:MAG TPA: ornithine cyclodeaminase family protein [Cyclobacteriaceae bacterium]|nr:ornithine cyclodeaminase family protein [Cyclobacteriaceae bacterium]